MLPERSGLLQLDLLFPPLFHGIGDPRPACTTARSAAPPFYPYQGPGKPGQAPKALRTTQTEVERGRKQDVQKKSALLEANVINTF